MVHVRTDGGAAPHGYEPKELLVEGGSVPVRAETLISLSAAGPFAPVALALEREAPLRDALAKGIAVPSAGAWLRLRWAALALAAAPLLMLLELDRELVHGDALGKGRFFVDLLLAAFVVFELTRSTTRMPAVAGAAMLAVAMRWLLVITRLCGKGVHWAVWGAAALSIASALVILGRAPSRRRVALELLSKLGISRGDADALRAARSSPVSRAVVLAAVAGAAGLPLLLVAMRRGGAGVWLQAAAFIGYAAIVPPLVVRLDERAAASAADGVDGAWKKGFAVVVGLVLTAALVQGVRQFFDAGGELARCTGHLDEESRRLLAAEARELTRRVASVRASTALAVMTTAVMPLAEERIYRGLLMNVLVRRYGMTYGLFASALAFGVAHGGGYEVALYQTVLLGIGFGLAYAEGGLIAAFVVHATWNLLNLA